MSKNDKDFAKLLGIMREQGSKDNPTTLELGIMTSSNTCSLGDLELEADDILINEYLVTPPQIKYEATMKVKGGTNNSYEGTITEAEYTKTSKLKKGDMVVLMRVEDQDMYVILCKVVDA